MANYATLKAAIQNVIKQNGNNEITGPIMQSTLLSMVNSLGSGYQFAGVATPSTAPGTVDQRVFYLAGTAGTYSNFGNSVVYPDEIAVLYYDTSWHKLSVKYTQNHNWAMFSPGANLHAIRFGQGRAILDKGGFAFYHLGNRYRILGTNDKEFTNVAGTDTYIFIDTDVMVAAGTSINWDNTPNLFVVYSSSLYPGRDKQNLVLLFNANSNQEWTAEGLGGSEYALQKAAEYRIETSYNGTNNVLFSNGGKTITFKTPGISIYRDGVRIVLQHASEDKTFTFGSQTREYLVIDGAAINFNAAAIINILDYGDYIIKRTGKFYDTDIVLAWYYLGTFMGGLLSEAFFKEKINVPLGVMTELSDFENLHFGYRNLKISSRGFTLWVDNVRYDITGASDYLFDYSVGSTRQYLCVDFGAVLQGERTFENVLVSLTNTVPESDYIVLLSTYYNTPQPNGLFYEAYLKQLANSDMAGDVIFADVDTPGKRFAAFFKGSGSILTMLFFTDQHLVYNGGSNPNFFGSPYWSSFFQSLNFVQKFANMVPVDFVMSGGDWLNNADTKDMACYELGQIKALLDAKFKKCYLLLGNHDTNYQGKDTPESPIYTGQLDQQTINNLWYNDVGKSYYKIERQNCDIYCFDSGTDGRTAISPYDKEQLNWFAQNLSNNTKQNIVLATHIVVEGSSDFPALSVFANAIEQIADAFNRRTSVIVDGSEYIFTHVTTGKVRCLIGGHTHYDYMNDSVAIPIFVTRNFVAPSVSTIPGLVIYTFDLIFIDFTAGLLRSVRVGEGNDRTLNLS